MPYKITSLDPFGVMVEAQHSSTHVVELDISSLRHLFERHQLVLLRGFTVFEQAEDFADYCEQWGEVSIWPFGRVLELIQKEQPEDHIFDSSYMPMHWDGMYRPQVPEYQIFQCVEAPLPGNGGRTTFCHTMLALDNASEQERSLWRKATGHYQRKMEFYHSKTVSPIVMPHPYKGYEVIRYNEPHVVDNGDLLNPPGVTLSGISDSEAMACHQSLRRALYDPRNFYAHEWQSGDIVITDNFSLLHGREAFTLHTPRHIRRVQVLSNPPYHNPSLESYECPQE